MSKKLKRPAAFLSALVMVLAMLMYFPSGMFSTCFGLKASAAEITMTEPSKDTDGVYQIGTAGELYWFADKVNNDNGTYGSANAVLTADIVVNENVLNENGELNTGNFISWTPIGNYDNKYAGTFDGQVHTVSGVYFNDSSAGYVGLFGSIAENGEIRNVGVIDPYFNGHSYVGGVCGKNDGTITECYNTGNINGVHYVGGVCGNNNGTIESCYSTGTVGGNETVGGVCGYNNTGRITNSCNTGKVSGTKWVGGVCGVNIRGIIKNCYFNSNKYIGDAVCNNDGGTVTNVDGKTTEQFASGEVCELVGYHSASTNEKCGLCKGNSEQPVLNENGYYEISNANQLYWFADKVNNDNGTYGSANAVLTADIVVNENVLNENGELNTGNFISWTPIGNYDNKYAGTFDGKNHTISGLYFNNSSTDHTGLFGLIYSGGAIKNVGVIDSYFKGSAMVGGVCGVNGGRIINCYSTGTVSGSLDVGGVCGWNSSTITNCYNSGTVKGTSVVGGVCGGSEGTITNCYNIGKVTSTYVCGGVCGSNSSFGTISNCYYLADTADENGGKTTAQFESGEVCELVGYHSFMTKDKCGLCKGDSEQPVLNENGYYEISNANQLYWFADKVNNENRTYGNANAVLTADIVVNTGVLKSDGTLADDTSGFTSWTPIGNKSNKYSGTFNGQGHTVSGLYFKDMENSQCIGLFGWNNGTVKNIGVIDSYIDGYMNTGGVCGYNESGTITNCYNTSKIIGSSSIGGLCGANSGTISNCYNKGAVTATGWYGGGVCGRNDGTIKKCYFDSTVYDGNAVGTNNNGTLTDVDGKTPAQFGSGEVAYLLSQGTDGLVWGQTIGTENYPVLGGKKVLSNCNRSAFANDIIVYGQSASLDGTIGFNIYIWSDDAYNWSAKINNEEVTMPVKNAKGICKFTYQVAAKDMDNEIQFTINDKIDVTVSVSEYLAELSQTDDESLKNLVNSMSDYGNAAEAYFGSGTVAEQTVTDDLNGYAFTLGTMPEGISYCGSSLILESETTIRHYFTLAEGENIADFTFKVNNSAVTPTEKQGYYYIDIENISAEKLGTAFTVSINGEDVITKYSALSYANKVLGSDTADDNLKNLVKALYLYNKNALGYNMQK